MITVGTLFRFSFLSQNSNMCPVTASYYCPTIRRNWQKQPPEEFLKKGVLRNFAKFTGKHLCQSLFFNEVTGLRPGDSL